MRDPYRGVVLVLLAASLAGVVAAASAGLVLPSVALLDLAVTLGLAAGVLFCVALTQDARANPRKVEEQPSPFEEKVEEQASPIEEQESSDRWKLRALRRGAMTTATLRSAIAGIGLAAVCLQALADVYAIPPSTDAIVVLVLCLIGAGLAATAASYLAGLDTVRLPESVGLCRGARVVAWMFVLAAASLVCLWFGQVGAARILHVVILSVNAAVCYSLWTAKPVRHADVEVLPVNFGVLSMLGSRPNVLASVLDAGERQLGIDLRSTWALTVVRSSVEPLVIGLCLLAWLSTSLTIVGVREQGLVERLGVATAGPLLSPGLHVHWPWPVDVVVRVPVQLVQTLAIGHEGEESGGPEDVLWARQHAANEFTLLLGNGRDLITIDAAVQFRIADARAWRYHTQNPGDALRAIGYRAVMRNTVNRTLTDALSENVVSTTARMRAMVQQEADALGLGVEILGFTVGGMHPPVPVAPAYQGVVSAQLGRVTAVVRAQAERNRIVPYAETTALTGENAARAAGARALGVATGEAWSFLALQAQYGSAGNEYLFRRRLETLERNLAGRHFTIVDARFLRDGGELWVTP